MLRRTPALLVALLATLWLAGRAVAVDRVVRAFTAEGLDTRTQQLVGPLPVSDRSTVTSFVYRITREYGATWIKVTTPADGAQTVPIITLNDPPIMADDYAFTGTVAYAGTDASGDISNGSIRLELRSTFADGSTLAADAFSEYGPQKICGHSAAGPFRIRCHTAPG